MGSWIPVVLEIASLLILMTMALAPPLILLVIRYLVGRRPPVLIREALDRTAEVFGALTMFSAALMMLSVYLTDIAPGNPSSAVVYASSALWLGIVMASQVGSIRDNLLSSILERNIELRKFLRRGYRSNVLSFMMLLMFFMSFTVIGAFSAMGIMHAICIMLLVLEVPVCGLLIFLLGDVARELSEYYRCRVTEYLRHYGVLTLETLSDGRYLGFSLSNAERIIYFPSAFLDLPRDVLSDIIVGEDIFVVLRYLRDYAELMLRRGVSSTIDIVRSISANVPIKTAKQYEFLMLILSRILSPQTQYSSTL